jgi:hypothetical protein
MMMAKKPRMVVVVALANKMTRIVWALTVRETTCRAPAGRPNRRPAGAPVM